MRWSRQKVAVIAALIAACGDAEVGGANAQSPAQRAAPAEASICTVEEGSTALPEAVRETSGLARSAGSDRFWTHNDANNTAELFAFDEAGRGVQRVQVVGAQNTDWEDIAAAPCDASSCLYIGDIGDNDSVRDYVTIYIVPEPAAGATTASARTVLRARYPDGPRDAEGLFVAPSGDIYIVTKGRGGPVALYRLARPGASEGIATLERVRELFGRAAGPDRVTAATMTPDGAWVAIRSYRALFFYRADELLSQGGDVEPIVIDVRPLRQPQGEAVEITADGTVWLTSEAESRGAQPLLGRLRCTLP